MKILVTGASGFLGAHLVRAFAVAGCTVLAGHRRGSDLERLRMLTSGFDGVTLVPADFDNFAELAAMLERNRPSLVVNAAAYGVNFGEQDLKKAIACNVTAAARLVDASAANGIGRLIHIGSAFEYGVHAGLVSEETPLSPIGLYGATKAGGSLLALARARALGLPLCVVRPFGLFGPLEGAHKFVPQVFAAARTGKPLDCTPGEQIRDYTFVGDVTAALVRLADACPFPEGRTVNLASGKPITLRQLGEAALEAAEAPTHLIRWGASSYRPNEVMCLAADAHLSGELLGWSASTPLAVGLRESWESESLRAAGASPACPSPKQASPNAVPS